MIVKIDHVALGAADFFQVETELLDRGYHNSLNSTNVVNMNCTKEVMKEPSNTFSISLFEKKQNIGVELLNYGSEEFYTQQSIIPVFGIPDNIENLHTFYDHVTYNRDFFLNLPACIYDDLNYHSNFNGILLYVRDIDSSLILWNSLRFKTLIQDDRRALLSIREFLNKTFYLYLVCSPEPALEYIDALGYSVIALITTDIHQELDTIKKLGYQPTQISSLRLDRQNLEIFFFRDKKGTIIEIVGVQT